jgi:Trk-type K+ transport system membrane component
MDLRKLTKICFTICIVSIMSATLLAFMLIWGNFDKETVWRSELSVGVLFLASVITLSVSRTLGGKE